MSSGSASNRRVAIVDYGMGNLRSVENVLRRLGADVTVATSGSDLASTERIVLPGVGAFPDGMANLRSRGFVEPLEHLVLKQGMPFLGICLGMELLAESSEEVQLTKGLGWLPARIKRFDASTGLRIPHVGWNSLQIRKKSSLLNGVSDGATFYFVHSFHVADAAPDMVTATSDYGGDFPAVVEWKNIFATQFHPEKSQDNGRRILLNFLYGT